jgi:hypothetical protein
MSTKIEFLFYKKIKAKTFKKKIEKCEIRSEFESKRYEETMKKNEKKKSFEYKKYDVFESG